MLLLGARAPFFGSREAIIRRIYSHGALTWIVAARGSLSSSARSPNERPAPSMPRTCAQTRTLPFARGQPWFPLRPTERPGLAGRPKRESWFGSHRAVWGLFAHHSLAVGVVQDQHLRV
jgi:hypothetical protein